VATFSPELELVDLLPFENLSGVVAGVDEAYVFGDGVVKHVTSAGLVDVWAVGYLNTANPRDGIAAKASYANLALPQPGRIVATSSQCWFLGAMSVDLGNPGSPAIVIAGSDRQRLEGPVYAQRVAAGESVWVMQGDYTYRTGRQAELRMLSPWPSGFGGTQRWSLDGQIIGQHNYCGALDGIDVTLDGDTLYQVTGESVYRHDGMNPPRWRWNRTGAELRAGDAAGQQLALLDAAAETILLLDPDGSTRHEWSYLALGENTVAVDLALGTDRIWLADAGTAALISARLDGEPLARIELAESPAGVAVGPDGDVFVLSHKGQVYRFAPNGERKAVWRLPLDAPESGSASGSGRLTASDIDVGTDGRVYVPFSRLSEDGLDNDRSPGEILQSGVWVFEPRVQPPPGDDDPGAAEHPSACTVRTAKLATPGRVQLGQTVGVVLRMDGTCPGTRGPHQVVFVVDTSGSMRGTSSNSRLWGDIQSTLVALIEGLDPRIGQAAVVSFADRGVLDAPLTDRLSSLRAAVLRLAPGGATNFAAGIDDAVRELTGPRRSPAARASIVLVTDGVPNDDPRAAIQAAHQAGIHVEGLIYPTLVPRAELEPGLQDLLGAETSLRFNLRADQVEPLSDALSDWRSTPGLFERVTIRDAVPANMRLVPDSVAPKAELRGGTLTWDLGAIAAADGVTLRYRLQPLETGVHPTNLWATAAYEDALGTAGQSVFPVPRVEVVPPQPSPTPMHVVVHLPIALRESPVARTRRTDVVLVIDASQSMAGAKLDAAKAAADRFLDLLPVPENRIGLIAFNEAIVDALPPTEDTDAIRRRINSVTSGPGTRIDLALAAAARLLTAARAASDREPVVVLLTDGRQSENPAAAVAAATQLRGEGIEIWAIGLGGDVDAASLAAMAGDQGRVRLAPQPTDLAEIYAVIARILPCRADDYWARRCG